MIPPRLLPATTTHPNPCQRITGSSSRGRPHTSSPTQCKHQGHMKSAKFTWLVGHAYPPMPSAQAPSQSLNSLIGLPGGFSILFSDAAVIPPPAHHLDDTGRTFSCQLETVPGCTAPHPGIQCGYAATFPFLRQPAASPLPCGNHPPL